MNSLVPNSVLLAFSCGPTPLIEPLGAGNINDTFKVVTPSKTLVLQKINSLVFPEPTTIGNNLEIVSDYLTIHYPDYVFPHPLHTVNDQTLVTDAEGVAWRALPYFAGTISHNIVPSVEYAYQAARAFAEMSRLLQGLDPNLLQPTIPDFHNLTLRETQFTSALQTAGSKRLHIAESTIEGFSRLTWIGDQYRTLLQSGVWVRRIYHHDTKINNILFQANTAKVVTVVDLDTIMPGYVYSDVGDLLMFGTSVFEDETDLSKMVIDNEKWQAILAGYQTGFGGELTVAEKDSLPFSGLIMCYMLGLRFLTDYLNGEVYFKTKYAGQNLDKAKNRLCLLEAMVKMI